MSGLFLYQTLITQIDMTRPERIVGSDIVELSKIGLDPACLVEDSCDFFESKY